MRWKRGDTILSPASFIPLAEEIGIITLITGNVIDMVSRDLPRFLSIDPAFYVSVNMTASDLKSAGIVDRLDDLLRLSGASPRNIVVEATEHGLIKGPGFQAISKLRAQGFRVAIDDFGTGYSNLSTLQELELDLLKIDKAFVDTIGEDGAGSNLVLHVIEIARSLHLQIVAESVETEAQARFLVGLGVEYAQGWLFGRPVPIDDLCKLLRENGPLNAESAQQAQ